MQKSATETESSRTRGIRQGLISGYLEKCTGSKKWSQAQQNKTGHLILDLNFEHKWFP